MNRWLAWFRAWSIARSERQRARAIDRQTIEQLSNEHDWWRWRKRYEETFR